jgi:hypothetical protein
MLDDDTTGAINTDDNTGAPPVMGTPAVPAEDDSTGVDAAQQPQSPSPQAPSGLGEPKGPMGPAAKRIIAYLMGADAAHPQSIDAIGQQIDPQGQMPPADRNIMAIDHVRNTKGDNAAWSLMQANRVAYNGQMAFAKTALEGTQQKPASIDSAVDAANKAQANVLDGSNIQFAAAPNGITATVTLPGTTDAKQIALSPQAFAKWLDIGGDGQWDKVMENSAPATLERLAKQFPAQAQPAAPPQRQNYAPIPPRGAPPQTEPSPVRGRVQSTAQVPGQEPGKRVDREYQQPEFSGNLNDEQSREKRSYAMFPRAHLDSTENAKREAWLAGEEREDAKLENAVNVAKEKGEQANKRAEISGGWKYRSADVTGQHKENAASTYSQARVQAAQQKIAQEAAREEALNGRNQRSVAMHSLSAKIATGAKLNDTEQKYWDGVVSGTPEPKAAAPAGQQQQFQPAPTDPSQRKVGQTYLSPTGKRGKWMGNGWQPVQ